MIWGGTPVNLTMPGQQFKVFCITARLRTPSQSFWLDDGIGELD
jgi:hypothetical protein